MVDVIKRFGEVDKNRTYRLAVVDVALSKGAELPIIQTISQAFQNHDPTTTRAPWRVYKPWGRSVAGRIRRLEAAGLSALERRSPPSTVMARIPRAPTHTGPARWLEKSRSSQLGSPSGPGVLRTAYGHLTSATNILRRCWRHICFDKATALCDILYKRLRKYSYLLTYLCTLKRLNLCSTSARLMVNSSGTASGGGSGILLSSSGLRSRSAATPWKKRLTWSWLATPVNGQLVLTGWPEMSLTRCHQVQGSLFRVPPASWRTAEGWVDQGGSLHNEMVYPPAYGHLSKY